MKLPLRYIKLTKPKKAVLPSPADSAEELIKSANNFTCVKKGRMLLLTPRQDGRNVIAARLKPLTDGSSAKIEYAAAFDILRFLAQNALPLLCFAASVALLLISLLGSMQVGLMWITAAVVAAASLIYIIFGGSRADKQCLIDSFEAVLNIIQTAEEENEQEITKA